MAWRAESSYGGYTEQGSVVMLVNCTEQEVEVEVAGADPDLSEGFSDPRYLSPYSVNWYTIPDA